MLRSSVLVLVIIILLVFVLWVVSVLAGYIFKNDYKADVKEALLRTRDVTADRITESDLSHLPELVRNYLRYVGVVGRPKVYSFKATFSAEMRGKNQDWFSLTAEQYNFLDANERLFWLDASVKGLPTKGYHRYKNGSAGMEIKLLGLVPVVEVSGEMMFKAETVTFFNDMCFLAPATLIDKRIQWQEIDDTSVKATFTNRGVEISGILHFNEAGELINFVSDDRYDVNDKRQYRFSTPLSEFRKINSYHLPTYGEAIWHYPDGEFVYGRYKLVNIDYNVRK